MILTREYLEKNYKTNILYLSLMRSDIEKIEDNVFISFGKLKILRLECNQLTEIDENTFNGLFDLEELYANDNYIKKIHKNAFSKLTKLKHLNLTDSKFTFLHKNTFSKLINIETISMCCNYMKKINRHIFSKNKNLKALYLPNCLRYISKYAFVNNKIITIKFGYIGSFDLDLKSFDILILFNCYHLSIDGFKKIKKSLSYYNF
jgi:Leucine-rich repeat (LRR) protein